MIEMRNAQHQKPPMKFSRFICILLGFSLLIFILSGCTIRDHDINNFDNVGFYANLKADALSPIGRKRHITTEGYITFHPSLVRKVSTA